MKNADTKSLLEISKAIADLAGRARDKKLKPEEVQGGTFTITNPGVFGALFGMPIISQPQVAIVGVGAVEKRPVVVDDAVTIGLRAYMTIGYDHRIIDGAVADEFMQHVKKMIENWEPDVSRQVRSVSSKFGQRSRRRRCPYAAARRDAARARRGAPGRAGARSAPAPRAPPRHHARASSSTPPGRI